MATEEEIIDAAMEKLIAMKGDGTKLIIGNEEFDIRTALTDYRIDLVMIFDEDSYASVQISTTYNLEENEKNFLWINGEELGILKRFGPADNMTGNSLNYRSMLRSPKTQLRIGKLIKTIYNCVLEVESLALE